MGSGLALLSSGSAEASGSGSFSRPVTENVNNLLQDCIDNIDPNLKSMCLRNNSNFEIS